MARGQGETRDARRFPGHREVLLYLQDFARKFRIEELIRFHSEVVSVELIDDFKWKVKSHKKRVEGDGDKYGHVGFLDEIFDAVVVCNGHHTEPRIAEIPGIFCV